MFFSEDDYFWVMEEYFFYIEKELGSYGIPFSVHTFREQFH